MKIKSLLYSALLALIGSMPAQAADALLIYAAASLTNVLQELEPQYRQESGTAVKFSFSASSTLARQIEAGAQADVFFSADTEWMDYLQNHSLIDAPSRSNLLGNRLVLIAPADSSVQLKIAPRFALAVALGKGRLAMGDPDSVPAGKYARAALSNLGVWNDVADRIVRADNVRAALAFVGRGEAPLGIVYATDAQVDKQVRVVDTFPADTHEAIVYPIARTVGASADAAKFIEFLRAPSAQQVFRKYGFTILQ